MEVTVTLDPLANRTEDKFLRSDWLTIEPFNSKIIGLFLCFQNPDGNTKKTPVPDTTKHVKHNFSGFGYFWFEYSSADKEYKINVEAS